MTEEEKKEEKKEVPPPIVAIVDKDTAKEIDNALGTMMTNPNFMGIIKQFADLAELGKEEGIAYHAALDKKLQDMMTVLMALHSNQVLDHEILERLWVKVGLTEEEAHALDEAHKAKKPSIYGGK
jgi:hypothetical protein